MQVSEGMLIHEMMSRAARRYGTRVALRQAHTELSYELLDGHATRLSEKIGSLGLARRHGALFIANSLEYVTAYFALAKSGALIVPVPVTLPPARLVSELTFCEASFVITTTKYRAILRELLSSVPTVSHLIVLGCADSELEVEIAPLRSAPTCAKERPEPHNDEAAVMLRTSGTASHPKWVMLSHGNLMANVAAFLRLAKLDETERAMITLPLTSAGTNTTEMLAYIASGITSVLYPHSTFMLGEFCRTIDQERITIVNATPFLLDMMLWKSAQVARSTTSLRKIFFASAPIAGSRFQRLLDTFPHVEFYRGYGLTEAAPRCSMLEPHFARARLESSGLPLEGVTIRIVDEAGRQLGTGEIGEITIKGTNVMLGYYKQPGDTTAVLQDGWLHTGDCGYIDERGFVFVKGRKKNIVITQGISVCPEEVEQEIMAHPDVRDAYVTGFSDECLGESLVAHVVPREWASLSERDLKRFLRERLEPAKVPGRILFVDKLHRNHAYKLVRDPRLIGLEESRIVSDRDPFKARSHG